MAKQQQKNGNGMVEAGHDWVIIDDTFFIKQYLSNYNRSEVETLHVGIYSIVGGLMQAQLTIGTVHVNAI